jgi:hypothetical protein
MMQTKLGIVVLASAAIVGCGGDAPMMMMMAPDCATLCKQLAPACGIDVMQCEQQCSLLMPSQISCLQKAQCDQAAANACLDPGGQDGGTSSCDPKSQPACDSTNDVVSCSTASGVPIKVTTSCGSQACSNGQCVDAWMVCQPFQIDNATFQCPAGACRIVVNGGATAWPNYCTCPCGSHGECPNGFFCNSSNICLQQP